VLDRPRLRELAGTSPLVIVTGATGSGTTTAAAQIAGLPDGTAAWCRLAAGYDRAADVVAMVTDSLEPGADDDAGDRPASRVVELADHLLTVLEEHPVAVVVDDHHLAADGEVDRLIAECAGLLPDGSRFVVAGATRPAGLIGLVPRAVVLDAQDLAFDAEEARALFGLHGAPAERADAWSAELGGWVTGLVAGAASPGSEPSSHLAAMLERVTAGDPALDAVLDVAAVVPYVTPAVLTAVEAEVGADELRELARRTPLLDESGDAVALAEHAATVRRERLGSERVTALRARAGRSIADDDPATAIDVLLLADEPEAAADVLSDHLSEIGVDRALTWLYRLPAELRRRFPPVLAAGQATVEVDSALAAARERVDTATTDRTRREALFALGSVERHRGELAAAASAFEAAARTAHDDERFAGRVSGELATTRFLLGDLVGARAALAGAPPTPETGWLLAQLDAVEERDTGATAVESGDDAFSGAGTALRRLVGGDVDGALAVAEDGYRLASDAGGDRLAAAGPVLAWCLLRSGRVDEALVVVDEFERRLGPRHQLGRIHGAIVRERISRDGSDRGTHERDVRRLRDLRATGYATIERLADRALGPDLPEQADDAAGVRVEVLGVHRALAGDRRVGRGDWRSKKAFEVLTVLAMHGPRGGRREQVIEAVWPGRDPDKGRTLLRTALSEIRRVLEPDRPAGEASRFVEADGDVVRLDGVLDVDDIEVSLAVDPATAFEQLSVGLAPEIVDADWASEVAGRVERLTALAASTVPDGAPLEVRVAALESLISAEPWQREHYDALAALHRDRGDDAAAADVERRWFADD
jgi:DNA-binding SARP family transcriptional activator